MDPKDEAQATEAKGTLEEGVVAGAGAAEQIPGGVEGGDLPPVIEASKEEDPRDAEIAALKASLEEKASEVEAAEKARVEAEQAAAMAKVAADQAEASAKATDGGGPPPRVGSYEYAKAQGASDEEAAKYVLEVAEREREADEERRPKRYYATAILRVDESVVQPGRDISSLFGKDDLEAFVKAGSAELK